MVKYKIFIAHPDEKAIGLYRASLKDHFGIDSASDGLTSLRKIKLQKPHLILSTTSLPVLSGIGLLRWVRAHPELHARPFILLGSTDELPLALNLGANDFFDQSWTHEQMIPKIYYHIKVNQHLYAL
jgi:DNA-binding response OmpR family regulator